jgi:AcrR family transcriptional regulator
VERAKKDCILLAAAKAFARLGFRKASVDEIARDAGVAKGTVYLACESKEDLFYQALHREIREWVGKVAVLIDPRRPADELLVEVAAAAAVHLESNSLIRELLEGKHAEILPAWADRLEELRALGRRNIDEILAIGVRQGVFREDLDVTETAQLLQDLSVTAYLLHQRPEDRAPAALERRMRAGLALVLDGMRTRETKDKDTSPRAKKAREREAVR